MILINDMNFSVLIRTRGRLLRHYTGYNIFDFSQVPYITLNVVTYIPTDLSYIINTFKCYIISSRVTVHIIVSPCRTTYRQIPFDVHFDEYPFTGYRTFRMTIFFSIFVFSTCIIILIIQKTLN